MKTKPKFVTKLFAVIDGYAEAKAQNVDLSKTAHDIVKPLVEN